MVIELHVFGTKAKSWIIPDDKLGETEGLTWEERAQMRMLAVEKYLDEIRKNVISGYTGETKLYVFFTSHFERVPFNH